MRSRTMSPRTIRIWLSSDNAMNHSLTTARLERGTRDDAAGGAV
jgi:hypothetical protein